MKNPTQIRLIRVSRLAVTYLAELINAKIRLAGASNGSMIRVSGRPRVKNNGKIHIGSGTQINSTTATVEIVAAKNAELIIGENVRINYGCTIGCTEKISIGDRTRIGPHTSIMDSNFHEDYDRSKKPKGKEINIGDDVLIGAKSIILKGVTIGTGSIVGAGSVVTKDIPEFTVSAGNPARVIRNLEPSKFSRRVENDLAVVERLRRI